MAEDAAASSFAPPEGLGFEDMEKVITLIDWTVLTYRILRNTHPPPEEHFPFT